MGHIRYIKDDSGALVVSNDMSILYTLMSLIEIEEFNKGNAVSFSVVPVEEVVLEKLNGEKDVDMNDVVSNKWREKCVNCTV